MDQTDAQARSAPCQRISASKKKKQAEKSNSEVSALKSGWFDKSFDLIHLTKVFLYYLKDFFIVTVHFVKLFPRGTCLVDWLLIIAIKCLFFLNWHFIRYTFLFSSFLPAVLDPY